MIAHDQRGVNWKWGEIVQGNDTLVRQAENFVERLFI